MPRREPDQRVMVSVRLSPALHADVNAAAEELDVSVSWLVERLLKKWIEDPSRARTLVLTKPRMHSAVRSTTSNARTPGSSTGSPRSNRSPATWSSRNAPTSTSPCSHSARP